MLTVDLRIRGNELFSRDFSYLRLDLFYQRDLGVYFHIFEVNDHNIIVTAISTGYLQIQGHTLSCIIFHISIFHIFEVKDHNSDIIITAILNYDLQIQGHALFCVTSSANDSILAI